MDKRYIYADNAATTRVSDSVMSAMMPWFQDNFANPSGLYSPATSAAKAIRQARADIAKCLNAEPGEVFFTSCGTEADNWAIKSAALLTGKKRIITSRLEHHAVLKTCEYLKTKGFEITYLPCSESGIIDPEDLKKAIGNDVAVVSVMLANNEIGTIQRVSEMAEMCHEYGVLMHTDAVQAVGNISVDFKALRVDMLSLSGHKIHAPKGIGALLVRKGINLPPFIHGGKQEAGRRAGTENVPYIMGLRQAILDATTDIEKRSEYVLSLREKLIDGLLRIEMTRLNGDRTDRLSGNANISFYGIEGESLALLLDMKGICVSSGSACTTGDTEPSHVLKAIGLTDEWAKGALRVTLSEDNTASDVDYIIEMITEIVGKLRESSTLWKKATSN
ncbi:MAG: aminotransferase class V-fold PLP-dependent enzyme [Oscillospiraceae bacterium]|nr:aminotransferase class V-fold PLP-dependent enzyme [Oscillospiraceae bacterium]